MTLQSDDRKPMQQAGDQPVNCGEDDVMDVDNNVAASDTSRTTKNITQNVDQILDIPRETPPSAEEQAIEISRLFDLYGTIGADEIWYLVSTKWLRAYRAFVNLDENWKAFSNPNNADIPSPIDNEALVISSNINVANQASTQSNPLLTKLRSTVMEGLDYEYVPQQVWNKLYAWYGGGPAIARRTYQDSFVYKIEVFPYFVEVAHYGKSDASDMTKTPLRFQEISVSKKSTMKDLKAQIKKLFKIVAPDNELRLHAALKGSPYHKYDEEMNREVEEVIERPRGQQLILEEKSASGWRIKYEDDDAVPTSTKNGMPVYSIVEKKSSEKYTSGYSSYSNLNNGDNVSSEPGVCGLQNLGNTCFMNSALQCLTKTPVIRDYFVTGAYTSEINRDNPLGMSGKIAEAFGNLMKDMFSGRHSYISPREFKHVIGKFAPQFSGYQQQDSQELIAYLLDGLHEDLNRILKKPFTEAVESKGRKDEVVAEEAWKVHKLRNDSIIVDKFQGQLKSELVCPNCGNVSITFDPFMYLSLPLPIERNRMIDITIHFYGNRRPPLKCQVSVSKRGKVDELRKAVADIAGIAKPHYLVIVEIFSNKIYRYLSDTVEIKAILDNDVLFAYEMSDQLEIDESIHTTYTNYDNANLPFAAVRLATTVREEHRNTYSQTTTVSTRTAHLAHPFVIPFNKKASTNKELYDYCMDYLRPYLKIEELEKHNIKLDEPENILYKGPTEKQRLKMEAERERQRKQREKEERERNRRYRQQFSSYNHSSDDDSDKMSDDDKEDDQPQQPPQEDEQAEEEEEQSLILFTLRFEDTTYSSSSRLDSLEDVLPYDDRVVEIPRDKYYSSSYSSNEKKSLLMYMPEEVVNTLIDQQKLKQVELHDSIKPAPSSTDKKKQGVSLYTCLELFTTREQLSSNDTWYCPECKKHVEATKKFDLWRLPEVLVVHLKRFQFNRYNRDKLETFIDYPINGLDLTPHIQHNLSGNTHRIYDLFAVSNHYGGLGGGHYTAFAKIQRKNQWYKFDDSYTSPINEQDVRDSSGYVLFYLARNQDNNNNASTNNDMEA